MRWLWLLLLLACGAVHAADITLIGPTAPVDKNDLVLIEVRGLESNQLRMVRATSTPSTGVTCRLLAVDAANPTVFFQTKTPGKYVVRVELNGWRYGVETGLVAALQADIDPQLIAEIGGLVVKLVDRYPVSAGSLVVDVGGAVTVPVDPNVPPVDPTTRIDRVTYVYEKDQNIAPKPVSFALQRLNTEYENVIATEFEEDTVDGDGDIPDQYKIALDAARKAGLPALVIQAGSRVVKVVKAPTTEAQVMDEVLK